MPQFALLMFLITRTLVLGVAPYPQQTSLWCWAACGKMVLNYIDPTQIVDECGIVKKKLAIWGSPPDCCSSTIPDACILAGAMSFPSYGWTPTFPFGPSILNPTDMVTVLRGDSPVQFSWNSIDDGPSSWAHFLVASGYATSSYRRLRVGSVILPTKFFVIDPEYGLFGGGNLIDRRTRDPRFIRIWASYATQLVPFSTILHGYDNSVTPGPSAYDFVSTITSHNESRSQPAVRLAMWSPNSTSDGVSGDARSETFPNAIETPDTSVSPKMIAKKTVTHVPVMPSANPISKMPVLNPAEHAKALAAAKTGVSELPAYLNASTCKLLGFATLGEVKRAKVDPDPLAHYSLLARNLNLADSLSPSNDLTYLVKVDKITKSSVRVFRDASGWHVSSYGAAGHAIQLANQRKISSKQLGLPQKDFFLLNLPELSTELLAVNDPRSGLEIAPLHDDTVLNFSVPLAGGPSSQYVTQYHSLASALQDLGK